MKHASTINLATGLCAAMLTEPAQLVNHEILALAVILAQEIEQQQGRELTSLRTYVTTFFAGAIEDHFIRRFGGNRNLISDEQRMQISYMKLMEVSFVHRVLDDERINTILSRNDADGEKCAILNLIRDAFSRNYLSVDIYNKDALLDLMRHLNNDKEQVFDYGFVRTDDGVRGWVCASYTRKDFRAKYGTVDNVSSLSRVQYLELVKSLSAETKILPAVDLLTSEIEVEKGVCYVLTADVV